MQLKELIIREATRVHQGVLDYVVDSRTDYCANFGEQWNTFRTVQIDSVSRRTESHERFFAETGWAPEDLRGKTLLDAGCGAGRFAEVAMECGARVVAVDLSTAAWACQRTLSRFPSSDWLVLRADLFNLPLRERSFDGVYSLGVLQHTPDPLRALHHIARFVAPGGRLATWIYERASPVLHWSKPRTYIRAAAGKWPHERKLALAKCLTAAAFPVGWALSWFGHTGEQLSSFLPYAARHRQGRGSWRRQWEYSVMDTFDWYGPYYDYPQVPDDVMKAMRAEGFHDVQRRPARGMAITGEAPVAR